jgi:hypothetical protein
MLRMIGIALFIVMVLAESGCGGGTTYQPGHGGGGGGGGGPFSIRSISPTSAAVGSPDLTLTVTGSGFSNDPYNDTQVIWEADGIQTYLVTTFVNSTTLTAVIPAALLSNAGTAKVSVQDTFLGDPDGDPSNFIDFVVTP